MSDAAIATIVTGVITVTGLVIGFFTLWIKIRYGVEKVEKAGEAAEKAADKAVEAVDKAEEAVDKTTESMRSVEEKVDENTAITSRIEKHTNGPLNTRFADMQKQITSKFQQLEEHAIRIASLEVKVEAIRVSLDGLNKNLDSTRHELRGHLQTISNSLNILAIKNPTVLEVATGGK